MILEGERGTKKKEKKKRRGKEGTVQGQKYFQERERERESRYHLNQVASISYCTCHLWQRWHRFLPGNLHHPLLGSDLRINHPFFFFLPSIRANFSLRPNSPVLYFCREFPPRKAYNNQAHFILYIHFVVSLEERFSCRIYIYIYTSSCS